MIWKDSGRSSRGERMALSTSIANGPAMSMASVTLTVSTGWASRTFAEQLHHVR